MPTTISINDVGVKLWTSDANEIPVLMQWVSEQYEDMKRRGVTDAWRWDFRPDEKARLLAEDEHQP
jgi:hypothetical protein